MSNNYIFLKTEKNAKGELSLKCLPHQKDKNGKDCNPSLLVTHDIDEVRNSQPCNIYAVEKQSMWEINNDYNVDRLIPLNTADQQIRDEYNLLMADIKNLAAQATARPVGAPPSFFERIERMFPCPQLQDCGFHFEPKLWKVVVRNILKGKNTLLEGPSGCGKTEVIKAIAKALGQPLTIIHMNNITDPEQLCGSMSLVGGADTVFDYAEFAMAIQKPGIVLLDEINRCNGEVRNALLGVLDDTRTLDVHGARGCDRRFIPVHKDCSIVATANIAMDGRSSFCDTEKVDDAMKTRFFFFEMNHLPKETEAMVLAKKKNIDINVANSITEIADEIRKAYQERVLSSEISMRETQDVAELVSDGMTVYEAFETRVLPLYVSDGTENDEREIVKNYVTDHACGA